MFEIQIKCIIIGIENIILNKNLITIYKKLIVNCGNEYFNNILNI